MKTANLQEVGHLLLSISIPITVNNEVDTCIKCLTNQVFLQKGGVLEINDNIGETPTRLLCIKRKDEEEFSVYEYPNTILLERTFFEVKRKTCNRKGIIEFDSILNLRETIVFINDLLSKGEILSAP